MPTATVNTHAIADRKLSRDYERELDDAFDRVYAKYGPDLSTFFDDVQKAREKEAQLAQKAPAARTTTRRR